MSSHQRLKVLGYVIFVQHQIRQCVLPSLSSNLLSHLLLSVPRMPSCLVLMVSHTVS